MAPSTSKKSIKSSTTESGLPFLKSKATPSTKVKKTSSSSSSSSSMSDPSTLLSKINNSIFGSKSWSSNLGFHYDKSALTANSKAARTASRDMFDSSEAGGKDWGMLCGGIEVVDLAKGYVRGQGWVVEEVGVDGKSVVKEGEKVKKEKVKKEKNGAVPEQADVDEFIPVLTKAQKKAAAASSSTSSSSSSTKAKKTKSPFASFEDYATELCTTPKSSSIIEDKTAKVKVDFKKSSTLPTSNNKNKKETAAKSKSKPKLDSDSDSDDFSDDECEVMVLDVGETKSSYAARDDGESSDGEGESESGDSFSDSDSEENDWVEAYEDGGDSDSDSSEGEDLQVGEDEDGLTDFGGWGDEFDVQGGVEVTELDEADIDNSDDDDDDDDSAGALRAIDSDEVSSDDDDEHAQGETESNDSDSDGFDEDMLDNVSDHSSDDFADPSEVEDESSSECEGEEGNPDVDSDSDSEFDDDDYEDGDTHVYQEGDFEGDWRAKEEDADTWAVNEDEWSETEEDTKALALASSTAAIASADEEDSENDSDFEDDVLSEDEGSVTSFASEPSASSSSEEDYDNDASDEDEEDAVERALNEAELEVDRALALITTGGEEDDSDNDSDFVDAVLSDEDDGSDTTFASEPSASESSEYEEEEESSDEEEVAHQPKKQKTQQILVTSLNPAQSQQLPSTTNSTSKTSTTTKEESQHQSVLALAESKNRYFKTTMSSINNHLQATKESLSIQNSWSTHCGGLTLSPLIYHNLSQMDYLYPTPIQATSLSAAVMGRRDIVGAAPTGSGKTLAYGIPIVEFILKLRSDEESSNVNNTDSGSGYANEGNMVRGLIIVPTRELALQVAAEIGKIVSVASLPPSFFPSADKKAKEKKDGKKKKEETKDIKPLIEIITLVGGLAEQRQERILKNKRPEILVCTPGRMWGLLQQQPPLPHLLTIPRGLRFLVIDEADRMIKQGNYPECERIFEFINKVGESSSEEEEEEEEEEASDEDEEEGSEMKDGSEYEVIREEDLSFEEDENESSDEDENDGDSSDVERVTDEELAHFDDEMSQSEIDKLLGLSSEKDLVMLDDAILSRVENDSKLPEPKRYTKQDERKEIELAKKMHRDKNNGVVRIDRVSEKGQRQTFIFSATLTLSSNDLPQKDKDGKPLKKHPKKSPLGSGQVNKNMGGLAEDSLLADIMEKAGSRGVIKVCDLTSLSVAAKPKNQKELRLEARDAKNKKKDESKQAASSGILLPPGLTLYQTRITQKHKDSYLYAFLSTTVYGTAGPCIVFCNSIMGARRVGDTLEKLGVESRVLHGNLEQKARLSALDLLKKKHSRAVLVATDIAARGLDIPFVASVVHYDCARSVDSFIHRSGRTARGVGEKAVGTSYSLIASAEEKNHMQICKALNLKDLPVCPLDSHLLTEAQKRTNLAVKIVQSESVEFQATKNNSWFTKMAEEADLDLDDNMLDGGQAEGQLLDRQRLADAKRAKKDLAILLSQPMKKQHFSKFLGSAGAQAEIKAQGTVVQRTVTKAGGAAGFSEATSKGKGPKRKKMGRR